MRLDKNICLGGRFNNKDVIGIKLNGHIIYEYGYNSRIYKPYEFRDDNDLVTVDTLVTSVNTHLDEMFQNCNKLTTINGIDDWDTSNVTNMSYMFHNCSKLTSLDLSSFDTSNVKYMDNMFFNCTNLVELNLSNFTFVEYETHMFEGCINLKKLDLSNCKCYKYLDSYIFGSYEENRCLNLIEVRLDNCDYETVKNIARVIPDRTGQETRGKIYIDRVAYEKYGETVWHPNGWDFVNKDTEEIIN